MPRIYMKQNIDDLATVLDKYGVVWRPIDDSEDEHEVFVARSLYEKLRAISRPLEEHAEQISELKK